MCSVFQKVHHYTYFILPVYNFPSLYSAFRTDSGRKEHLFGNAAFSTSHVTSSFTQTLNWKVCLVGVDHGGQKKLALTLHLLNEVPVEKLNHFFNLTSSLKHLPSGFSSRKTFRFGEEQFRGFNQRPSQLWTWFIDDKKNLFEECDYDRFYLGNVAEYISRNSGVFEIRISMRVTVRDQPMVATYRPQATPQREVHYVVETKHSGIDNMHFLLEFHTSDGIVKVHKHFCAAESPYIKKIIENVSDDQVCKVHFPSVSTKAMKNFVMFMYSNKVDKDWKSVASEIIEIGTKLWGF